MTVPVHDRHQINGPSRHREVRDIRCPHLVGTMDVQPPREVGVHIMVLIHSGRFAASGTRHASSSDHQPLYSLAIHQVPAASKVGLHTSRSVDGRPKIFLVHQSH